MSVCDEGWGEDKYGKLYCPCLLSLGRSYSKCEMRGRVYSDELLPASCPFVPILRALSGASEEQREAATMILTQTCGKCWACTLMEDGRYECGDPDSDRSYIKLEDKPCILFEPEERDAIVS